MKDLQVKISTAQDRLTKNLASFERVSGLPKVLKSEQSALEAFDRSLTEIDDVPHYSWAGCTRVALLLRIIDGDTIKVALVDRNCNEHRQNDVSGSSNSNNNNIVQLSVRLYGIDCAEMRPRRADPDRNEIKVLAALATGELSRLLTQNATGARRNLVQLYFMEHDKYGRPMAIVKPFESVYTMHNTMSEAWANSCNKKLIDVGLALPYTGDAKWTFAEAASHYRARRTDTHRSRSVVAAQKRRWWHLCCCFARCCH